MPGSILGTKVLRSEDTTLLTGSGKYVGDLGLPGCLHACFVRSASPHARLKNVEVDAARQAEGVKGVFLKDDLKLDKLAYQVPLANHFKRWPLAFEAVRFVGEPIALVVAETYTQAKDAAELVEIDYDPLPVRSEVEAFFGEGNVSGSDDVKLFEEGDILEVRGKEVKDLHKEADKTITARIENSRMAVVPLETHTIAADPTADILTVWLSSQGVHSARDGIAESLGIEKDDLRVISPWVGGGFGAKGGWEHEHIAVVQAARLLNAPVLWSEERSENLLSMQARQQVQFARLGLDKNNKFTSLEVFLLADSGGYIAMGAMVPIGTKMMAQGVYDIPKVQTGHLGVCTNKSPMGVFRGAGRPQATALIERMVDLAAYETGIDPVELRRQNFISKDSFPFKTQTGTVYDTGDYGKALDKVVELADYGKLREEQSRRREAGGQMLLGIGVSCYVEITAGFGSEDYGSVEIHKDGTATIKAGTSSHGQGHETTFGTIVSEKLGIAMDKIRFIQADTAEVPRGDGTGGSRSAQIGGSAVHLAAEKVLLQARELAAHLLEANPDDICVGYSSRDDASSGGGTSPKESSDGETAGLQVAGSPNTFMSWAQLAEAAEKSAQEGAAPNSPSDNGKTTGRLFSEEDFAQEAATFPFGAHITVVEVDSETGKVFLKRHIAVDDCGTVLSPLLVEGQQHGGAASGISQALWENMVYDEDCNPLTSTLAEYLMPSAAEFPELEVHSIETPTHLNPLGAKGIGEASTIGSTPAVQNAVIDAVSHLGIRHIDMPTTPEKIWQAIKDAKAGKVYSAPDWPDFAHAKKT